MLAIALIVSGISLTACHDKDKNNNPSPSSSVTSTSSMNSEDQDFMKMTSSGNLAEIQIGQLVASKTSDSAVKSFAQTLVNDHTLAQNELKTLATGKNVTLPDTLTKEQMDMKNKLQSLSGRALDSTFVASEKEDHQKDEKDYQMELQNGQDPDVKGYAGKNINVIEKHLQIADSLYFSKFNK